MAGRIRVDNTLGERLKILEEKVSSPTAIMSSAHLDGLMRCRSTVEVMVSGSEINTTNFRCCRS